MEYRLKLKLSKLIETCRSKNLSDVSSDPFFFPENHNHRQLIALFSPKPHSLSKPKQQIENKPKPHLAHPKTSNKTTPVSHKTTKKKPRYRKPKINECFSSTTHNYYHDWRSSDDEDDTDDETTIFSSRSFRSESSVSFRKKRAYRKSKKKPKRKDSQCGFEYNNKKDFDEIVLEESGKLVKDSIAVAKKSSNPYEDFRASMVEMIVEKQIFGKEGLTNLFECFVSLNSDEHHRVIFEVFTEILEALFNGSD